MKASVRFLLCVSALAWAAPRGDAAPLTLRVGTYNIRHGADVGLDFSVLARDIRELKLDVVGLQEVDQKTGRVKGADTLRALSEASGMKYSAFARAIPLAGGEYGTGILSRHPIKSFRVIPLDSGTKEARSIGHAVIDAGGRKIHVFNTHLSYESKGLRAGQFRQIAGLLAGCADFLVTGDFNTGDTEEFRALSPCRPVNQGEYLTCPSDKAGIDNIVISPCWEILSSGMLEERHSDHRMLWAELRLRDAKD